MPWDERSVVDRRREFVELATCQGTNFSCLCSRYGISRRTGYKWVERFSEEGVEGLKDRSRRPDKSPGKISSEMEALVLALRTRHPAWGGRKLRARLQDLGTEGVPAASTITEILRRHGQLSKDGPSSQGPWKRFESSHPNELWQMDFKGYFPIQGGLCHPLTVLDDHSRFAVGLESCGNENSKTVQECLIRIFSRYGLPDRILSDNGSPWGSGTMGQYTKLEIWLMDHGVGVIHGRPKHPQTQGKDERFHRTLKVEVIQGRDFRSLQECQEAFDEWRSIYNLERPHESLGMRPPIHRYEPSRREYQEKESSFEYGIGDLVRKVDASGKVSYKDKGYPVGKAFRGRWVALRPTLDDGVFNAHYDNQL
ncbi:MAG: IS481 family transposase, partial [Candidatus Omnitrophica bacterium]|nr:IS481 family transposase [Candidatus Omnitrophota bacterium]